MIKEFFCALLILIIIFILASMYSSALAVEMPKLDRSGTYQFIRYTFDNKTMEVLDHSVVGVGSFADCDAFIQKQGSKTQPSETHTVYGCERFEGPANVSS